MVERNTHYAQSVEAYMLTSGHATNSAILAHLQRQYPEVSATTVHRITARLLSRNKIAQAPSAKNNAQRFDTNVAPHDHFMCSNCDRLIDTMVASEVRPLLERAIGEGCSISGNLVITGICKECKGV